MTSPERQLRPSTEGVYLDPSARRALGHTAQLARENRSDIGVRQLYEGIHIEMGDFLVASDMQRKKIDPKSLESDLALVSLFENVYIDLIPSELKFSSSAIAVLTLAEKVALTRKPIAQEVTARNLLESLAVVAKQEADRIRAISYQLSRKRIEKDNAKIAGPTKLLSSYYIEINKTPTSKILEKIR